MTRFMEPMPLVMPGGAEKTNSYNPVRGNNVIAFARDLLINQCHWQLVAG